MTPEQKAHRNAWQDALREAERKYRWALETYNDEIREARKTFDTETATANKAYFGGLEKLRG
jgi:hypothetical protein